MAVQPLTARPQKDIVLTVGTSEYQKQVSNIDYTPNIQTTTETWQGGTPDATLTDTTTITTWTLNITAIQQLDDPASYCRWAFDHAGETATAKWKPHADNAFQLQASFTVVPPKLGGAVGKRNESTMANPCNGKPTIPTT